VIDPRLLEVAACPSCRSHLAVRNGGDSLTCTNDSCALAYPVSDGVPVLLVDEAQRGDGDDPGNGRAD
jgi:uncharacterized protein YbaR (Trm112 family)